METDPLVVHVRADTSHAVAAIEQLKGHIKELNRMTFWNIVGAGIAFGGFVGLLFLTFVGIGIVGLYAFVRFFGWMIR